MKVSITQANLNKGLGVVGRIVGSRASLPVLANILIATDSNRIRLSSTNLEIGINHWIGAKVEVEGSITVPARLLSDYVSSLSGETINLEQDKQILHIKTPQTSSHINGIAAEEFPTIPSIKKPPLLTLDAAELKEALSQVVGAASTDDTRPILNGVFFYSEDDKLVVVATDSYRLAEKVIGLGKKTPKEKISIIVPARTIQELLRMMDDGTNQVEVVIEENQALFRFGDTELISRLIEGEFPDYRQLIPQTAVTTVTMAVSDLLGAAKVSSLFARESGGSITLQVDSKKQKIELRATASQVGDSTSSIKVNIKGEDEEVTLNSKYVLDGLASIHTKELRIDITGKINPCLLRPADKTEEYLHLIMPLRA